MMSDSRWDEIMLERHNSVYDEKDIVSLIGVRDELIKEAKELKALCKSRLASWKQASAEVHELRKELTALREAF